MSTADGYLHREMDSHGVRAKADVLGVQVAELRAGYIHSKEKESRQVSFHGKEAHMHRDTSFEGLGTDVRIGSGQAPGARLQSGLGRFQESISCASKDGTESFHSQQMVIGGHTKASLAGKTMDLRAGYIHSKEQESRQVSFHGKEAHMHRETSFEGFGADVRSGSGQAPIARLQSGLGHFQESISCASKDGTHKRWKQDSFRGHVCRINGLDLDSGTLHRHAALSDFSLTQGYVRREKSTWQKSWGRPKCLQSATTELSDAVGFMYHRRSASYEDGIGAENVQVPFFQYSRQSTATVDGKGDIKLNPDAEITDISLSDVTRGSIRQSANFLHARNIHNLDAGGKEILDGVLTCGKSALVDELTHGFVAGMQNRGYPMRTISIALNMVAKPLWRAYQAEGELGLRHQMERGIMDWLRLAGEEALDRPFEFVTSCVNTAAPLLGSDLNVQWTDDYKGFRLFGYGLGVGTQVDLGKNGFVEDTGVHGSYRLRSTLNTVGVCLSWKSSNLFHIFRGLQKAAKPFAERPSQHFTGVLAIEHFALRDLVVAHA